MINSMNRHSPIRMMGLASGMDTDMIIQQTLRMHQFRIDNRMRERTLLEWRQETHNSLRDEINGLRADFMRVMAPGSLVNRRTFNSTVANVSSVNTRNAGAVSIGTNTSTPVGSLTVNSVVSLARGASIASRNNVSLGGASFESNARLENMAFAGGGINFQTTIAVPRLDGAGNPVLDDVYRVYDEYDEPVYDEYGEPVYGGGNPIIDNFTVTRQAWDGAIAGLSDPLIDNSWSNATATLNIPGATGAQPRVEWYDDGANRIMRIMHGTTELARIPHDAEPEFVSNEFQIPGVYIDPEDPLSGEVNFQIIRDADGNVTITNGLEDDDDDAINIAVNNLTFTQTATIQVQAAVDVDSLGNPIFAEVDINVERRANFTGATGQAFVAGANAVPTFYTEFSISNVVNGETRTETFRVNSNTTISSLMDQVNRRSNLGVTMSYNRLTDSFSITSNRVGGNADDITITDGGVNGNILSMFGLTEGAGAARENGTMAVAYINGERTERATNTFDFRGLQITLNHVTEGNELEETTVPGQYITVSQDPITVNFTRNADDAIAAIRTFLDAYNALVQRLETLTTERQTNAQRSYRPLTDEEEMNMTERQVEEWNRIARIGIMRHDNSLERLAFRIRREFFNQIEGAGMSASELGLTTGTRRDGTGGQIILTEDGERTLREALERDPERVADVFARIETNPDGTSRGVGLMHQLDAHFRDFVNESQRNSLESLENSLRQANQQIERMQTRMFAEEDRLFRQFAAMETAMTQMQNQGAWFNSMLGQM